MFRNNGIFRDVLLRISDKNDFWDIDIKTRKLGAVYSADVTAYIEDGREVSFTIKGTDHDGNPMCHTLKAISKEGEAKVTFTELEVLQWSAENPVLYDLYIESPYSCIHQRVGFKSIDISEARKKRSREIQVEILVCMELVKRCPGCHLADEREMGSCD